jgi:hypothetical protein
MRMMARWKDNFINLNLEGCFSTFSILEVKEKTVEDEAATRMMEVGDDDMTKNWNHDLMIIIRS